MVASCFLLHSAGKKDCEGAWSAWAVCSVPCGGGTQTRTYAITRPARSGGDACPAADGATEPRPCSLEACPLNCTGHPTGTAARLAHCWDCADGTVHGNVRSAGCIAGTTGSASALCNNGTYEITQNCTAGEAHEAEVGAWPCKHASLCLTQQRDMHLVGRCCSPYTHKGMITLGCHNVANIDSVWVAKCRYTVSARATSALHVFLVTQNGPSPSGQP